MSNRKDFFGVTTTSLKTLASATAVFITAPVRLSTDRNSQSIKRLILHSITGASNGTAAAVNLSVGGTKIHPTINIPADESVNVTDFADIEYTGDINMHASGSSGVIEAEYSIL